MATDPYTASTPLLYLDRSRVARDFDDEESLWGHELFRLYRLLQDHIDALDNLRHQEAAHQRKEGGRLLKKGSRQEELYLSIALFGSHGSGKSSLLKTFVARVNNQREIGGFSRLQRKVASLPVLEPRLLAQREHFLYNFLATVWQELDDQRDTERGAEILTPAERVFQSVSEDLRGIDERELRETDPLGASLERLEQHASSARLRKKLHQLIQELAIELTDTAHGLVLMPVDDADVSFSRLMTILDSYRRYLQHPQLVPVFTFSSVLGEELLRVHFAETLKVGEDTPHDSLYGDPDSLSETYSPQRITRQMASQYLARLFPSRNRLRLRLGAARVQKAEYVRPPIHRDREPDTLGEDLLDEAQLEGQEDRWVLSGRRAHRREELQEVSLRVTSQGTPTLSGKPRRDLPGKILNVKDLLINASWLLFGHSRWPEGELIRVVLRPATLRRQLQLVDLLAHIGIEDIREKCDPKEKSGSQGPIIAEWADAFDDAAWAIFDVHREVLDQLRLKVEDLFGWTRQGLRQLAVEAVLALPLAARRKLVQQWSYGTRDRRNQVLSLFAAQIARPPVEGAEDFAIEHETDLTVQQERNLSANTALIWFLNVWFGFYLPQMAALVADQKSPSGRKKEGKEPRSRLSRKDKKDARRLGEAGWSIYTAASLAARRILDDGQYFLSGTSLVHYTEDKKNSHTKGSKKGAAQATGIREVKADWVTQLLKSKNLRGRREDDLRTWNNKNGPVKRKQVSFQLLFDIWCFHGVCRLREWVLLSLWRGLSLIGQILLQDQPWEARPKSLAERTWEQELLKLEKQYGPEALKECLSQLYGKQFEKETGGKTALETEKTNDNSVKKPLDIFKDQVGESKAKDLLKYYEAYQEDRKQRIARLILRHCRDARVIQREGDRPHRCYLRDLPPLRLADETVRTLLLGEKGLASQICRWLDEWRFQRVPLPALDADSDAWELCFIRRLHGDSLLGSFWHQMSLANYLGMSEKDHEHGLLGSWVDAVVHYWEPDLISEEAPDQGSAVLVAMLKKCPLLTPFKDHNPNTDVFLEEGMKILKSLGPAEPEEDH